MFYESVSFSLTCSVLGSRGIPVSYGGFETLIEELAFGLAAKHKAEVTVYCRSSYFKSKPSMINRVRLIYLWTPRSKGVESLIHSFISSIHVLFQSTDVVYFIDTANAPFCALLRLFGKPVVLHTDGLGWQRRKWGYMARKYYKFTEWLGARCATTLITDNPAMQEYYRQEYQADSIFIPYGSESRYGMNPEVYAQFNLSPKEYLLVVARLEPENNTDFVIEEFVKSKVKLPLVVVGDSPYDTQYMRHLRDRANTNVIFTGRINDQALLNALYEGANLYIHGHEVGGTNPSLLRAMHAGATPVVLNVPFNTNVINGTGYSFGKTVGDLAALLVRLAMMPDEVAAMGSAAKQRAEINFKWQDVIDGHAKLFKELCIKGS
jgi:glycosyltransferase involved in cell wall biosynthesis